MQAALRGIALAVAPNEAAYLPLGHRDASDGDTSGLFAAKLCAGQIGEREAFAALKELLEDNCVTKVGHDVKRDWLVLATRGIRVGAVDDVMLMSYVLDAGKGAHDIGALGERYFGREPSRFTDVKNKDKALYTPEATPIPRAAAYAAEDAAAAIRLWGALPPRVAAASTRRWSGRCRRCSPAWKSAASPSTSRSYRACRTTSARSRSRSRAR